MPRLFANYVSVEFNATVYTFLKHSLHLIESWEPIKRFLKSEKVVQHRFRPIIPTSRSTIATTLRSLWKGMGAVGDLTSRGIMARVLA